VLPVVSEGPGGGLHGEGIPIVQSDGVRKRWHRSGVLGALPAPECVKIGP